MFNWCLCCWTGNPIGSGHQAQASELSAYSISLWFQKAGESNCCVSHAALPSKEHEPLTWEANACLILTCSFRLQSSVASFWWPVNEGGPTQGWYFQKYRTLMRLFDIAQESGIGVPFPCSLKLGVHKSIISETHYWDVQCFASAQLYRTACADVRHSVCYKGKTCCHETSSTKIQWPLPAWGQKELCSVLICLFSCICLYVHVGVYIYN